MDKLDKRTQFKMKFNSIVENLSDPTLLDAEIVILDFEVSENGQCITKEVCEENMHTLVGKRITCQYIKAEDNDGLDAMGSHGEYLATDREGNDVIYTDSIAIGFIKEVYIGEYDGKECLMGKCTLWRDDKYKDITNLLLDWNERGIRINMSCEYLYLNYEVKDGIEYVNSPIIFTAHTVLNSEDRGEVAVVNPAYEIATMSFNDIKSWNNALNSFNKSKNKEDYKMENAMFDFLKSTNAISAGDMQWKLWDAFANVMLAKDYNTLYFGSYDIYPSENYVIIEIYDEEKNSYALSKVDYLVGENDEVTVDYENRVAMGYKFELVELNQVKNSLNTKDGKVAELEGQLTALNGDLESVKTSLNAKEVEFETLNGEKAEVDKKLNSANETIIELNETVLSKDEVIVGLNSKIEEMKPMVEAYETEQFEKALNSLKEVYSGKFAKIGATEIYELESTQELIQKCVNSADTSAKAELNQLLVDNLKIVVNSSEVEVDMCKSVNSLIPSTSVDSEVEDLTNIYEDTCGIRM